MHSLPLLVVSYLAQTQATVRGVLVPSASVVGDDDATSAEINPGALGFSATNLVFIVADLDESGRQPGSGIAIFGNLRLGSLSNALGIQWLNPAVATGQPDAAKITWGIGYKADRSFGMGFGFHWFISDTNAVVDSLFAADFGMTIRPFSIAALGFVLHNLNTPVLSRDIVGNVNRLERLYELELALRPLGRDWLELAGGATIGEESEHVTPRARIALTVVRGITLRADVVIDDVDFNGDGSEERDIRGTAGLALDFDQAGVFGAGVFGRRSADGVSLPGGAGMGFVAGVRLSEEHYRPIPIVPKRIETIVLEGDFSDRDAVWLLNHLRRLESDPDCAAVLLRPDGFDAGWATMEDLRTRMKALRKAGKPVYVSLGEATMREVYLATAAERVLIEPMGGMRVVGMRAAVHFFKGTLDNIGVRVDVIKIAEYKSAPEPLIRTDSSEPAREQREAMVDELFRRVVTAIAHDRDLTKGRMLELVDKGPYTARDALAVGLVDEIVAPENIKDWLKSRHGSARIGEPYAPSSVRPHHWSHKPRVAVIFVDGDIVDGDSRSIPGLGIDLVGGETVARAIERARDDPTVRAIVLRVDSPGGSVGGSDLIWREIAKARERKPVVASLGDVAASGGYYVASGAQKIFAEPSTITGSIGIFYGKLDLSMLLQKIGVTWEATERGARAGMESWTRAYTEDERAVVLAKLRQYYDRFLEVVSKGRAMPPERIDAVGRGHVWTGAQARERGLVDAMGGLEDAIAEAKQLAGLHPATDVELAFLPERAPTLAERLVDAVIGRAETPDVTTTLLKSVARDIPGSVMAHPDAVQARMDYILSIE